MIRLSKNGTAFLVKEIKCTTGFGPTSLKTAVDHLHESCYFSFGNITMTMKQSTGIPKGTDRAPSWRDLFFHLYEKEYRSSLISFNKVN